MKDELKLTENTQINLAESDDYRKYAPDVDDYSTLQDLYRLRLIGVAARVMREHQYMAVAQLYRTGRWKEISTAKITCYNCDTTETIQEHLIDDELLTCPYCGSENVIPEPIPAFESESDFKKWITERLDVGFKTIKLRINYIDKCEQLDISLEDAFQGLTKWGVNWMSLTTRVKQKYDQHTMELEDAQNVLRNPDSFMEMGQVVRFRKELEEKDKLEQFSIPNSPDFVSQVVDPDGHIRSRMYYIGIPIDKEGTEIDINTDNFWETALGQMIAKRQKIMTEITYSDAIEIIDYNFYDLWEDRVKIMNLVRSVAGKILSKWDDIPKDYIKEATNERRGPVRDLKLLTEVIVSIVPVKLEPMKKSIAAIKRRLESGGEISEIHW